MSFVQVCWKLSLHLLGQCKLPWKEFIDLFVICGALRNSVHFVQFKKRENHPWRSVTKINTPPWVFFTVFKLYKWYQIEQRTTYIQASACESLILVEFEFEVRDSIK